MTAIFYNVTMMTLSYEQQTVVGFKSIKHPKHRCDVYHIKSAILLILKLVAALDKLKCFRG